MTPRRLKLSQRASSDLRSRARVLKRERGEAFAIDYAEALITWLKRIAEGGAQLGTAVGDHPTLRSFGYRRQATILAEYTPSEMRIVRIYFRGQDWSQDHRVE